MSYSSCYLAEANGNLNPCLNAPTQRRCPSLIGTTGHGLAETPISPQVYIAFARRPRAGLNFFEIFSSFRDAFGWKVLQLGSF
jgi:hypothetical protein